MSVIGRYWFPVTSIVVCTVSLVLYFRGQPINFGVSQLLLRLAVTFFLGLSIDAGAIRLALQRIRYQAFLQLWIFVGYPTVILLSAIALSFLVGSITAIHLLTWNTYLALLAVSVLPTTISSCIAFTRNSGGNPALSLVGSSTSNFLGIILAPLVFMVFSGQVGRFVFILPLLGKVALTVVAPILCGQLARFIILMLRKSVMERFTKITMIFCNIFVLLNVIAAVGQVQSKIAFINVLPIFILFTVSYIILLLTIQVVLHLTKIVRYEAISFLFTSSQKTLTFGIPLLAVFFDQSPETYAYALVMLLALVLWQFFMAGVVQCIYQYTSVRTV